MIMRNLDIKEAVNFIKKSAPKWILQLTRSINRQVFQH
jgi:hypothetical protein